MSRRTRMFWRQVAHRTFYWLLLPPLCLLALRFAWGLEAAHRMAKVRQALLAQGIAPDLPIINTSDDENPYTALERAADYPHLDDDEQNLLNGDISRPFIDADWQGADKAAMRTLLDKRTARFHWIEVAAQRSGQVPLPRDIPHITVQFDLARLVFADAVLAHDDGNDARALHDLRLILAIGRIVDKTGSGLSHLVATAIQCRATYGVERFEPTLRLDNPDTLREAAALLEDLQVGSPGNDLVFSLETEVQRMPVLLEQDYDLGAWWIRPVGEDDIARSVAYYMPRFDSYRATNWPAASALIPAAPPTMTPCNLNNLVRFSSDLGDVGPRLIRLHYHRITEAHAISMLLASRIFRFQHGRMPMEPAELVPALLPALPSDSFTSPPQSFRWRADTSGWTIWSVGENGIDDGGRVTVPAVKRADRFNGHDGLSDIVFGAAWREAAGPAAHLPPPLPEPPVTSTWTR